MKTTSFKRITSLILTVAMLLSFCPAALAADDPTAGAGDMPVTDIVEPGNADLGNSDDGSNQSSESTPEIIPEVPADSEDNIPSDSELQEDPDTSPDGDADSSNSANTGEPSPALQPIPDNGDLADNETSPLPLTGSITYYVANSSAGGSDNSGDGSEGNPFLTISHAVEQAQVNDADDLQIILLSDISSTLELTFDDADMPIRITSGRGTATIQFTGTRPIGTESGFIRVTSGAQLSFDNVTLAGSTGAYDGRVIYVTDSAEVTLTDTTVTEGLVNNVLTNMGGAGALVDDRGVLNIGSGTVFEGNETVAGGGAVFVADGGTVAISDDAEIRDNTARLGGGVYADTQTNDYGGLTISDSVTITGNDASENGSGMYICADANTSVQGNVQITGNEKGREANNAYLSDGATLDISGATTGADIGISADPEYAYRLVSLPDNYTIQPTTSGDEQGWSDDCGTWDIRYMDYQGQPGLYLYYKTLDVSFEDITTLTSITGKDINDETVDFLQDADSLPSVSISGSVLTAADTVAKNTPEDDDLSFTFAVDPDEYRIPTEDVISVTSGGQPVDFTYSPDFEAGTATITVDDAIVDTLTCDTIQFKITAEKYYDLTLRMEGPLYAMQSSITKLTQSALVISEQSKTGAIAHYKITLDGQPLSGVTIELYEEDTNAIGGTQITDADGVANFTGLLPDKSYYPILKYEHTFRVISRDLVSLDLSTLEGQNLAATYTADEGAQTGSISYDASTGKATITGITADSKVTFSVEQAADTITFVGNEGDDATTAPATLSMSSKQMPAGASTYGVLATAELTGYTFAGWYDAADGGNLIVSDTPYQTGVSARVLYAHWTANTNTAYQIQHWVEYAEGGANAGYEDGVTQTKQDNGITYYLYDTMDYTDGVSDQIKDISALDLDTMSDPSLTWWTRDGFTARFQQDCKVLADGTSAFSVYYDRNSYEITFDSSGAGTAVSSDKFDPQSVKFGALVGSLPTPTLPGYRFGGWYESDVLYTATSVYTKTDDTALTARWNSADDAPWAIKVAVQDLAQDDDGVYYGADTYTEYKTVYKANDGSLLTGTVDTEVTFNIADIDELTFEGFKPVGYSDSYDRNGAGMTANADKAVVYVDPTDMSTDLDGKYNELFDGGIVWIYYDRKTAHVTPDPDQPGGDTDGGDVIYGGDFTGQLPPDPTRPGYDFDGWEDPDGNPVDENTPADDYVEDDGTIIVTPTWEPRDYRLTYVPGDKATFIASDGSAGVADPDVAGGYKDSHDVTYDQAMGQMPSASKPGYVMDGWFLEDDTQITSDTVVTIDSVVIKNDANSYEDTRPLYAHYTPHQYTLVLQPGSSATGNPGTVSPDRVTVTFDQAVSGLSVPELTGYTFVGWVLDLSDPAGSRIENGDIWDTVYTNGAEIPVYATWVPNTYKYTFDLNDDIGSTKGSLIDTTIDHVDETFDSVYDGIFAVEAVRPGYDFDGWSLTEDGDVLTADDLVSLAQDTTVYAQWTPKEYDVQFVMKGSSMPSDFETNNPGAVYDAAADTWTIKVKFDSTYGTLPVPTKADSEYHGWIADAPHWDVIHNEIILDLPAYTDYQDENGITLTAVMEPWITFDPDGNTFDDGTTEPKKELQSDIDELPNVNKPDHTFEGWTTEDDPDTVLDLDDVKDLDEPTVLVPKFSANITFVGNGGTVNGQEQQTIALSDLTALPSASRSGYTLDGWFTAADGGTQVSLAELQEAGTPATVYAHWTVRSTGGGGGGGGGGTPSYTITVTEGEGANATPDGKVSVSSGGDKTIEIGAEDGYVVTDVLVDGESVGAVDEYTFENVRENHTLEIKTAKLLTGDHIAYINGYPDGGVHPEANITRAEVSAIFYRLLSDEARSQYKSSSSRFADANANWASAEIATLTSAGILEGYEDGTFRPDASITRAEFAAIASRFDKLEAGSKTFSDVPESHWAYEAISSAAEKGWINGYPDGTFRPENAITRAEAVTLANAVLQRECDETFVADHLSEMLTFNDLSDGHWAYGEIMEAANAHDYESANGSETWTALK